MAERNGLGTMLRWFLDLAIGWTAWFVRRPSLHVRILENKRQKEIGGLRFEIENRSPTATSLLPQITASFLSPSRGHYVRGRAIFDVRESDRHLAPYEPRILSATPRDLAAGYGFSWFLKFTFRPSRGLTRKVYLRNAHLEPIGSLRFLFEKTRFRLTGKAREYAPITEEEYDRMKRAQGPH